MFETGCCCSLLIIAAVVELVEVETVPGYGIGVDDDICHGARGVSEEVSLYDVFAMAVATDVVAPAPVDTAVEPVETDADARYGVGVDDKDDTVLSCHGVEVSAEATAVESEVV